MLSLFCIAILAGGAAGVRGQSALDGFDPNANGRVLAIVVQQDGKILIGGEFTTLSPNGGAAVTRNRIARLNLDGTVDTAFNPNANSDVFSLTLLADGKVLAGGRFTSIGGQTRNRIARLDATSGQADSFDPSANDTVRSIVVQADGKILAGGDFNGANSIGGQTRNRIARLDPTTGLADSFNPNANNSVFAIVVQTDGKILVGGGFDEFFGTNTIGGATRNGIGRLDPTTGQADSFNPNADSSVSVVAIQADGKIVVGGDFSSIGGQTRSRIARLDPTTGLADSFDPSASDSVMSIAVQADGKIIAGGLFLGIAAQTRNRIARLHPDGTLDAAFDPNPNPNSLNHVAAIAIQTDGKILLGGLFGAFTPHGGATITRNRIARLEADGNLDFTMFSANTVGSFVTATAVQPDGKILLGGRFTSVRGGQRKNFARLIVSGMLDVPFLVDTDGDVNAIAVQANGQILFGGDFTTVTQGLGAPVARNRIARLNPDGTLDTAFDPNASGIVQTIAVEMDGKILVGGNFFGANSIGGQTRNFIARLDAVTGLADSFNPNANNTVHALAVQADGKILVGGFFNGANSIGGQTRNRIARLDATTGLADSFDPNANGAVYAVTVHTDGKIIAGGTFSSANSIGGATRNRIARLDATTGLADSFDPNANDAVLSIAVQGDGRILAGGNFNGANSIGGQPRNRIARLDATTGLAESFNPSRTVPRSIQSRSWQMGRF